MYRCATYILTPEIRQIGMALFQVPGLMVMSFHSYLPSVFLRPPGLSSSRPFGPANAVQHEQLGSLFAGQSKTDIHSKGVRTATWADRSRAGLLDAPRQGVTEATPQCVSFFGESAWKRLDSRSMGQPRGTWTDEMERSASREIVALTPGRADGAERYFDHGSDLA